MAIPIEPPSRGSSTPGSRREPDALRGPRRGRARTSRRGGGGARTFTSTLRALDTVAASGAQVAVRITDLDRGATVLAGDDHVTQPVAGLGVVPLLIEVAAQFEAGTLDPLELFDRATLAGIEGAGLWQHLKVPTLPLVDMAVLAAASGDGLAANGLLERVGLPAVRTRIEALGLGRTALLDRFRDHRGPDDAPHFALSSARDLAEVFGALVNSQAVSLAVSAQVAEWLTLNHDLSLVASATGLDPFAHESDEHGLLFLNKTGRDRGIRVEAGVIAGPRAGVSYALIVCFDDLSVMHRVRAHEAFRTLGVELMEYVY